MLPTSPQIVEPRGPRWAHPCAATDRADAALQCSENEQLRIVRSGSQFVKEVLVQPVEVDGLDGLDAYSVSDEKLRQPRAVDQLYALIRSASLIAPGENLEVVMNTPRSPCFPSSAPANS
jgi:hypothetical protein